MNTKMYRHQMNSWQGHTYASRQQGVVLVITLILIVILALVGTFAVRNATQSERMMNGLRTNNVAQEAAETALRYCEQIAITDAAGKEYTAYNTVGARAKIIGNATTKVDVMTEENEIAPIAKWKVATSWAPGYANLITVPPEFYKKYASGAVDTDATNLKFSPTCIIQRLVTVTNVNGYVVTARGFANNAIIDANNKVTSGSEVWLQSILTNN